MLKGINPGELDRRLTIQEPARAEDSAGMPLANDSYQDLYTAAPAKRTYLAGTESMQSEKRTASQRLEYTMRYAPGITARCRVIDESITFEVEAVEEIGRKQGLKLTVKNTD